MNQNRNILHLARNSKGNDPNIEKWPPVCSLESPYFNEDNFSILLHHFQAQGSVLVCGNLIARTGQEPDTLSTQEDKHLPGGDSITTPICPPRHNYDHITNKNGSQLLQLCCTLGMYIVNGRLRGDSYGRYTYSKKHTFLHTGSWGETGMQAWGPPSSTYTVH